jgi:hypothetical protein
MRAPLGGFCRMDDFYELSGVDFFYRGELRSGNASVKSLILCGFAFLA